MQRGVRAAGLVALLLFVGGPSVPLTAAGRVWFVPWKVLEPGTPPAAALFILYWIPSSPEELRRSDLVTSRTLTAYSARCVAMHVIRIDDRARLEQLGASVLPMAVLADGDREIARLPGANGLLRAAEVEAMVRAAFDAREAGADEALDDARAHLGNGDQAGAAALYRSVVRQRCAFPRQAKEAHRALKRLRAAIDP